MSGLVLDTPGGDHVVRWVRDDAIGVGSGEQSQSFAVSPAGLIAPWPVADATALGEQDMALLLAADPEVILIGTGPKRLELPPARLAQAMRLGVGIEVMDNAAAARTYSILLAEQRRVLAAFVLPGSD